MRSALFLLPLASLLFAACAAPTPDGTDTAASESALTSARLDKSRIEVLLDQKNTSYGPGECTIDSVTFRVTYENPTLPAGTKITLHVGDSWADQGWIGDGFGWGQYTKRTWGNLRDIVMTDVSGKPTAETKASPYAEYAPGQYYIGMPGPVTHPAEIAFVFRLDLPDGTVLWDNRLRRDYWVSGNGPACPSGTTGGFVPLASWGPF